MTPNSLYLHLSQPGPRAVLGDYLAERGRGTLGYLKRVAERLSADAAADAAAADDAAAAADDDADDADASDAADDADDADASDAADDADDADALIANHNRYWRTEDMREGLLLIQVPGRYWGVTRVVWARRVEGDEWECRGVTVVRTGSSRSLASLAAEGPKKDHRVSEPDETTELLHRFTPRRVLLASKEAWLKHCPKPEGWE